MEWGTAELSQMLFDVLADGKKRKSTSFADSVMTERKERTMIQRFVHRNEMFSDKMYLKIGINANFLICRLNTRLALNAANEQQFVDIRQRTYLSDQTEKNVIHFIANVTLMDFVTHTQNTEHFQKVFELFANELAKNGIKMDKNIDARASPSTEIFNTDFKYREDHCDQAFPIELQSLGKFAQQTIARIAQEIGRNANIINAKKRFNGQWNLFDELKNMICVDSGCSDVLREFLQRCEHERKHNNEYQREFLS